MILRIGVAPRLPRLSIPEFQAAWRSGVAERVRGIDKVRGYVQNHAILALGRPVLGYPGFDGCAELTFDSVEAMYEALEEPAYQETIRFEGSLIDRAGAAGLVGAPITEGAYDPPDDVVKLVAFLRRHPGCDDERFRRALLESGLGGSRRRVLVFPDPAAHSEGRPRASCEVVEIRIFPDLNSAIGVLAGQEDAERERLRAGIVFGASRVLARPVVVI